MPLRTNTRENNLPDTRIAICADDFGMDEAVDRAVVVLAGLGRITAVSCLVDGPTFSRNFQSLKSLPEGTADIGLHLNFTEPYHGAGYHYPLSRLIARAYSRRLEKKRVAAEIERQLDVFESLLGQGPRFIDGHQHVHQLPVIRDALIAIIVRRYASNPPWLRRTQGLPAMSAPLRHRFKSAVISGLGCNRLAALAAQHHIKMNRRMMGVYDFAGSGMAYADLMQGWLVHVREGDLIMTHPADKIIYNDPIAAMRTEEYRYLSGNEFGDLLARRRIAITTMSSILHGGVAR